MRQQNLQKGATYDKINLQKGATYDKINLQKGATYDYQKWKCDIWKENI